jgi:hypothetical protein
LKWASDASRSVPDERKGILMAGTKKLVLMWKQWQHSTVMAKVGFLPLHDSLISIQSSVRPVKFTAKHMREFEKAKQAMLSYRGRVLGNAYEVEMYLDLVLSELFFPKSVSETLPSAISGPERRRLFDCLFLKGSSSFMRKVGILKSVVKSTPELSKLVAIAQLFTTLNSLNKERNRFAHCAIAFRQDGLNYIAQLNCRDGLVTVDDAYKNLLSDLHSRAWDGLTHLFRRSTGSQ